MKTNEESKVGHLKYGNALCLVDLKWRYRNHVRLRTVPDYVVQYCLGSMRLICRKCKTGNLIILSTYMPIRLINNTKDAVNFIQNFTCSLSSHCRCLACIN